MKNKYAKEIQNLDILISNWNYLSNCKSRQQEVEGLKIDLELGLCHNAMLYGIPNDTLKHIFASWDGFSGDYLYPVEGKCNFIDSGNKFNVVRLRLAKHLRAMLWALGSPKPTKLEKLSAWVECPVVGYPLLFVLFFGLSLYIGSKIF